MHLYLYVQHWIGGRGEEPSYLKLIYEEKRTNLNARTQFAINIAKFCTKNDILLTRCARS